MDEVKGAFDAARSLVADRPELVSDISTSAKLRMYALYKQALSGDAPLKGPWRTNPREYAKWKAWDKLRGGDSREAMASYAKLIGSIADGMMEDEDALDDDDDDAAELEELVSQVGGPVFSKPVSNVEDKVDGPPKARRSFDCAREGNLQHLVRIIDASRSGMVDDKDEDGRTMLHWACDSGHAHVVQELIHRGASVNLQDTEGLTPLHMACMCEHEAVIVLLLHAGADANLPDAEGLLPFDGMDETRVDALRQAAINMPGPSPTRPAAFQGEEPNPSSSVRCPSLLHVPLISAVLAIIACLMAAFWRA